MLLVWLADVDFCLEMMVQLIATRNLSSRAEQAKQSLQVPSARSLPAVQY